MGRLAALPLCLNIIVSYDSRDSLYSERTFLHSGQAILIPDVLEEIIIIVYVLFAFRCFYFALNAIFH